MNYQIDSHFGQNVATMDCIQGSQFYLLIHKTEAEEPHFQIKYRAEPWQTEQVPEQLLGQRGRRTQS